MADLFASGRAVDLILGLIALEAVALWLYRRATGRGPRLGEVAPFLIAGAGLLLALRAALVGAPWVWIAGALALSGVAHAVDLARRFRG